VAAVMSPQRFALRPAFVCELALRDLHCAT